MRYSAVILAPLPPSPGRILRITKCAPAFYSVALSGRKTTYTFPESALDTCVVRSIACCSISTPLCLGTPQALSQKVYGMSILFDRIGIAAARVGRRCSVALAVVFCDVATVQLCFRFDVLKVFGGEYGLSCPSLGLSQRVCWLFDRHAVPQSLILIPFVIGALIALGVYDPRPLLNRLERSRRPGWWLIVNAAGVTVSNFPYLLAAAGAPISSFAPWSPYLLILGASMMIIGLLCWLSDIEQLQGTLKPRHVLTLIVLIPATVAIKEGATELGWGVPVLQAATFNTTALFLQLLGEPVIYTIPNSR